MPVSGIRVEDVDLSELSVYKQLVKLDQKRSASPVGIPAIVFRRIAAGLALSLSIIFRKSMDERKVPTNTVRHGSLRCRNQGRKRM